MAVCIYRVSSAQLSVVCVCVCACVQLFAASLSLAPFIAFLILVIDIRVDACRMLWVYRRPDAFIAQDIGL